VAIVQIAMVREYKKVVTALVRSVAERVHVRHVIGLRNAICVRELELNDGDNDYLSYIIIKRILI
jgi:hypothetical protein